MSSWGAQGAVGAWVAVALLAACGGGGSSASTACAQAAQHVAGCLGVEVSATEGTCDEDRAAAVLAASCAEVQAQLEASGDKADGWLLGGWLDSFGGRPLPVGNVAAAADGCEFLGNSQLDVRLTSCTSRALLTGQSIFVSGRDDHGGTLRSPGLSNGGGTYSVPIFQPGTYSIYLGTSEAGRLLGTSTIAVGEAQCRARRTTRNFCL